MSPAEARPTRQSLIRKKPLAHGAFLVAIGIKGFDGAIETVFGLIVLIAGPQWIYSWAMWTIAPDLATHLAGHLGHASAHIVQHGAGAFVQSSTFVTVYLLSHGSLKLALAIFLFLEQRWIFPVAAIVLSGFVVYMTHRAMLHWSVWLAAFAMLDALTLALVLNEWRQPIRAVR
jgi:uncharacterized membrane protein